MKMSIEAEEQDEEIGQKQSTRGDTEGDGDNEHGKRKRETERGKHGHQKIFKPKCEKEE